MSSFAAAATQAEPAANPANSKKYKILTSDILIADVTVEYDPKKFKGTKLGNLVDRFQEQGKLLPGSKMALTLEEFEEFSVALSGISTTISPGGSSANTLTTLSKLLRKDGVSQIDGSFIGVTGHGMYSKIIASDLKDAGIKLLPDPEAVKEFSPQSATSIVIQFPAEPGKKADRAIATYQGNAKDILKPNVLADDMVNNTDAILVQGSLWQKFGETEFRGLPAPDNKIGFADKLLDMRWKSGKELWLAMPTHAKYGEENAQRYKWLMESANLVLGNEEEVSRVLTTPEERHHIEKIIAENNITPKELRTKSQAQLVEEGRITADEAQKYEFANNSVNFDEGIRRLQEVFKLQTLQKNKDIGNWTGSTRQIGFVTRAANGMSVVTADSIEHVPTKKVEGEIFTLGAGDTSFAGILSGYINGCSPKVCAELGNTLARQKLSIKQARLPDPMAALEEASANLAAELQRAMARAREAALG
ncbi:MAG: PfkB family carbohydrate kinase [Rickettsiales bacterium]|nr:PfkB family carbohydrate kinase [Rickettsiales bacterium]